MAGRVADGSGILLRNGAAVAIGPEPATTGEVAVNMHHHLGEPMTRAAR